MHPTTSLRFSHEYQTPRGGDRAQDHEMTKTRLGSMLSQLEQRDSPH